MQEVRYGGFGAVTGEHEFGTPGLRARARWSVSASMLINSCAAWGTVRGGSTGCNMAWLIASLLAGGSDIDPSERLRAGAIEAASPSRDAGVEVTYHNSPETAFDRAATLDRS